MRLANTGVTWYDGDWYTVQNGRLMVTDENPRNCPAWVEVNDEDYTDVAALDLAMVTLKTQLKTEFSIFTWGPNWHPSWTPTELLNYQNRLLTVWYYQ